MKLADSQKQTPDPWNGNCPSRAVLNLIGDKWAMLIFPLLREGPKRNSELLRLVGGISQKMLTETLRSFESHGLILRRDYGTVPPKVDYILTPLGQSLATAIAVLDQWVVDHFHEIATYRKRWQRTRAKAS